MYEDAPNLKRAPSDRKHAYPRGRLRDDVMGPLLEDEEDHVQPRQLSRVGAAVVQQLIPACRHFAPLRVRPSFCWLLLCVA